MEASQRAEEELGIFWGICNECNDGKIYGLQFLPNYKIKGELNAINGGRYLAAGILFEVNFLYFPHVKKYPTNASSGSIAFTMVKIFLLWHRCG